MEIANGQLTDWNRIGATMITSGVTEVSSLLSNSFGFLPLKLRSSKTGNRR